MLMSRTLYDEKIGQRKFVVDLHSSEEDVLEDVMKSVVWVEDFYGQVDGKEMHRHAFNVGRIVDPEICLSKLYVLPLINLPDGSYELRFLIVMAHQISDGLSAFNWFSGFIRILNLSEKDLTNELGTYRHEEEVKKRLPPAQEDLYPKVQGSKARERWFWAIVRVLRYLRKTTPQSFSNPLRREQRLNEAVSFSPLFDKIFDYSDNSRPPMNSGTIIASLSPQVSKRLMDLCRSIHVSIGAGCFALAGLAMMVIHEERYPKVPNDQRLPFAASFPLNPRAFFGFKMPADSCMLAFSEGIIMPYLPSSLPIEGRFKLTASRANRELRMYQKRLKGKSVGVQGSFDPHSPARLLANAYLSAIERSDSRLPEPERWGVNPQGTLLPPTFQFRATCGVSSIGSTATWLAPGRYDLSEVKEGEREKDFAADYMDFRQGVRARDEEFLIGSSSNAEGRINFGVSYDQSGISAEMAERWRDVVEGLLEVSGEGREKAKM
ncbi:hypothetical protein N0V90_012221 [Kalmusia sp. IMI 367209]|nr:hypothetical protein N0V90_012221 [Kalmusia sp. IMI 367209]